MFSYLDYGIFTVFTHTFHEKSFTLFKSEKNDLFACYQYLYFSRNLDLSHNRLEKLENKTHGLLEDCLSIRRKVK